MAVSREGLLAAAGKVDGSILTWNIQETTTQRMQPIRLLTESKPEASFNPAIVSSIAWSHQGDLLGFGDGNGRVGVWQFDTEPITYTLLQGQNSTYVSSAAISPDDQLMATGSCADFSKEIVTVCILGEIVLWDLNKRASISPTLLVHQGFTEDLAFHPDPTRSILASSGCEESLTDGTCSQGEILFWDIKQREPVGDSLKIRGDVIRTLAFSPEGNILASGTGNGRVIIWTLDLSDDVPIRQDAALLINTHTGEVNDLVYNADGSRLASSSCASFVEEFQRRKHVSWEKFSSGIPPRMS
ncbi:hypothetical protein KFU94_19325 [Chloroflexi bacterium TSY]|nr:hypothetical protein [Chloroflexi bacterium TSY]